MHSSSCVMTYSWTRCTMVVALLLLIQFTILLPSSLGFTTNFVQHTNSRRRSRPKNIHPLLNAECRDGSLEVIRTCDSDDNDDDDDDDDGKMTSASYNIAYKIYRPMTLSSQQACPILVLHGGPSVPSDYLFPLVNFVPYRSIVSYDQLGCGRSDEPKDTTVYSIEKGIDDLEALIKKIGLRKFHLFGQSYGGILGYEFLKRSSERTTTDDPSAYEVLSFTISSTPTSVPLVESEVQNLLAALMMEEDEGIDESSIEDKFQKTHICRTEENPQPLQDAYAHAGTVWRGTAAIADYVATPPSDEASPLPPAMVLRGEHDFVTKACIQDWKEKIWNHQRIREKELPGCSHHGLLENGFLYGDMIDSYCTEYDP